MEEINRLLSSTIIGAHRQDVWVFLGLTVLTSLVLNLKCRSVVLATLEPDMAHVAELRVGLWNGPVCPSGSASSSVSPLNVSGIVYAFASLVLPALIAKNLGRTARSLFFPAPRIFLGTGVIAFVLANDYDFPRQWPACAPCWPAPGCCAL